MGHLLFFYSFTILCNEFEYHICIIAATSPRDQWVNIPEVPQDFSRSQPFFMTSSGQEKLYAIISQSIFCRISKRDTAYLNMQAIYINIILYEGYRRTCLNALAARVNTNYEQTIKSAAHWRGRGAWGSALRDPHAGNCSRWCGSCCWIPRTFLWLVHTFSEFDDDKMSKGLLTISR